MLSTNVASVKIKAFVAVIFLSVAVLLLLASGVIKNTPSFTSVLIPSPKPPSPYDPITNATLGFQDVAVLSLKTRVDRRKAIVDAARATNISLTIMNGLTDAEVAGESVPKGWELEEHVPGQLGAYFSHMKVLDRIINENISTALILESDADWDMRIHEILPLVAKGVKRVMDYPFSEDDDDQAPSSQSGPYGDRWDVLWLGHCGSMGPFEGRVYQFNDSTAPPGQFEYTIVGADPPDPYIRPDNLRLVYELKWNVCTYAYAVTTDGARKLRMAGEDSSIPWDLRLNDICQQNPSVRCMTVWPQVFTAAFSTPTIRYTGQLQLPPPPSNPDNQGRGPRPGPAIQISARRNSQLAQGAPRESWIREW